MTPEDEAAIRARLEAAERGPWRAVEQSTHADWLGIQSEHFALGNVFNAADAEFIAHARTDVGLLLTALDEARTERDKAQRAAKTLGGIVEQNARMILDITGLHDWIDEDGDGDWGAVWEKAYELLPKLRAAESARRDLVSRLGFGDNITEPMADNDTVVAWVDEQASEASEWRESQRWRDECALAGHPDDEDCYEHDPARRLDAAESALAAVRAMADEWRRDGRDRGLAGMSLTRTEAARLLTAALATPTTTEETQPQGTERAEATPAAKSGYDLWPEWREGEEHIANPTPEETQP